MADGLTKYGFQWGPARVERCMEHRGTRVITVKSGGHTLEIAISPKGNNIRAWLDHQRLTTDQEQ